MGVFLNSMRFLLMFWIYVVFNISQPDEYVMKEFVSRIILSNECFSFIIA